ncbi:transporter DMT superfamily protein [Caballeronia choica]|jgi:chloramphenicol-sensitive protein RarD|uniref:Transporter DMT superfamily protein n=1 Tax=Caballeronia choica TaxID=326476 RepID=A0A158KPN6_9BURK|nr:EamA family transporter RarD [Caballeronia choica]SAL82955.1 transporter DMT superfamily protein [Caballeronia choica]
MNPGVAYAFAAFAIWGLFPIYFKALHSIGAVEMLAHRMAWSMVFLLVVLTVRRQWSWIVPVMRNRRQLARFAASAVLLSTNWGIYIWAVNDGRIVEASLGYFINPLINVLFGMAFLHERLRPLQWVSVVIAAAGVLWLTWANGAPPWISLALALTFGGYGLLRKTARLGALEGLTLETMLLCPLAAIYLAILGTHGTSGFGHASFGVKVLLIAAGPITAVPLLLFAAGARRIPLSMLGLIQYITPSLQLLIGVLIYQEPFGHDRLMGYGAIWAALAVYSLEGIWRARQVAPPKPIGSGAR